MKWKQEFWIGEEVFDDIINIMVQLAATIKTNKTFSQWHQSLSKNKCPKQSTQQLGFY